MFINQSKSHSNVTSDRNVTVGLTSKLYFVVYNTMVRWWRAIVVVVLTLVAWYRWGRSL